jgi:carbonic anhydrase
VRRTIGCDSNRTIESILDPRARDREAVVRNVRQQVRVLQEKKDIANRVAIGELIVVGAFYEKRSGMVDFLRDEMTAMMCETEDSQPNAPSAQVSF